MCFVLLSTYVRTEVRILGFEVLIAMVMNRSIFWVIRNSSCLWFVGFEVFIAMVMKRAMFRDLRNSSCFGLYHLKFL